MYKTEDFALKQEYVQDHEEKAHPSFSIEYQRALAIYKDEEYTAEADKMLSQIAQDPKIPLKIRQKQPLYRILVGIAKTLLLNEYEIVGLAAQIDSANWNFKQDLKLSEKSLRTLDLGKDAKIDSETKFLFMYLLLLGYFVKEGVNENDEIRKITAHCLEIYPSFKHDYKLWQSKYLPRLDMVGINKKWKYFRNPPTTQAEEPADDLSRDYNNIVSNIVHLTGYHSSKNDLNDLMELDRSIKEAQTKQASPAEEEGPRTLPTGFSLGALESGYRTSKGQDSVFLTSRNPSREPNGVERPIFVVPVRSPSDPERLIPAWRSLTPQDLEELMGQPGPNKKIKKSPSINEQVNEEENRIERMNSFMRLLTSFELSQNLNLNLFDREQSFLGLGDGAGIGRLFSRGGFQ